MKILRRFQLETLHQAIGFSLPVDYEVMSLGISNGLAALYVLLDEEQPVLTHEFFVACHGLGLPQWCGPTTFVGCAELPTETVHVFARRGEPK